MFAGVLSAWFLLLAFTNASAFVYDEARQTSLAVASVDPTWAGVLVVADLVWVAALAWAAMRFTEYRRRPTA